METKHTPRPWRASHGCLQVTTSKPGILEGSKKICDINFNVPSERHEETQANALLIVAAPEMFSTLIAVARSNQFIEFGSEIQKAITNAIAKALGRE